MARTAELVGSYMARGYTVRKNGDVVNQQGKVVDRITDAARNAIHPGSNLDKRVAKRTTDAPAENQYWYNKD